MSTLGIILGLHTLELIGFLIYRLIVKANKLQKVVEQQQVLLTEISQVIEFSNSKMQEIDSAGTFSSDDEVGFFFEGLKEIQVALNNYVIQ